MKWDRIEANWNDLRALAKQKWSRLTNVKFDMIAGKRDQLIGWLQAQYGISKAEAELEVKEWEEVTSGTGIRKTKVSPATATSRRHVANDQGGHMHAPALGSAAATLAVSLIYALCPPAPDTQMRARAPASRKDATAARLCNHELSPALHPTGSCGSSIALPGARSRAAERRDRALDGIPRVQAGSGRGRAERATPREITLERAASLKTEWRPRVVAWGRFRRLGGLLLLLR